MNSDAVETQVPAEESGLSERERRQAWASYARSYDRILPVLPYYREVVQRHTVAMMKPGIEDVLDVGAGTGNVSIPLASKGLRVTAVDRSPEMLAGLRAKLTAPGPPNLAILERDAVSLPELADGSFDGATILLVFYDMSRPRAALDEVARLLRPGGRLVTTETKEGFKLQVLVEFVDAFLREEGLHGELRKDWECVMAANRVLDPGLRESRLTVEEIEDRLITGGFTIERVQDSHLGQCATLWATKSA